MNLINQILKIYKFLTTLIKKKIGIKFNKVTIFFLLCVFNIFNLDTAYPIEISQKNLIDPYCSGKINLNSTNIFTKFTRPQKIKIIFTDQRKYHMNIFKLLKQNISGKISVKERQKLKKFQFVKIFVYFENKAKCEFLGKAKFNGNNTSHILSEKFASSLSVKIIEGNILHKTRFKLLTPESRIGKNEIFLTTLFEEIGILTPLTFFIETEINGKKVGKMIFQETISQSVITHNNRNKGVIIKANKQSQFGNVISNFDKQKSSPFNLGMASNVQSFSNKIKFNALDKINYLILQNYEKKMFYIDSLKSSLFESTMIASGAIHGLSREDRRFFYDFLNDTLEPIYYDGKSQIFTNTSSTSIQDIKYSKSQKNGATISKKMIENINKKNFREKLTLKGVLTTSNELEKIFNKIIKNLNIIIKSDELIIKNNFSNKYFLEHDNVDKFNFKLAFGGENNNFMICELNLTKCNKEKLNNNQIKKILNNQISKINNNNLLFLRSSVENYKKNFPSKNGINNMNKKTITPDFNIFYNDKISFNINHANKSINFNMVNSSGRAIIKSKDIANWKFFLNGIKENFNYKDDDNYEMQPNSCITFTNSSFNNISLFSKNTKCPNTFQFISSTGTIDKIEINRAKFDAFDADFSDLKINHAYINYAGQECIGVKSGKYLIKKANLNNCLDKAISSGELADLKIEDISIKNSSFGLVAKDSSIIKANNVKMSNTKFCLLAFRKKYAFQSSLIITRNNKYQCDNDTHFVQKGSNWTRLNN